MAQKTDTIIHVNGNILTGEIKKLSYGVVNFKMSGMGTIKFKQAHIQSIKSTKNFEIRLSDGQDYFGSLDTSFQLKTVKLVISNGILYRSVSQLVEMYPIKRNFWLRTSGAFDLGFDYSKGSGIAKLSFSGNISYRRRRTYTVLDWKDNNTYQSDTLHSTKTDVDLSMQQLIKNQWYISGNLGLNTNSELGLRLRTYVSVSIVKDLVHSNINRLYAALGPTANREFSYGVEESLTNIEGYMTVSYELYKLTDPEINISTNVDAFPSFSVAGRWRINYNADIKVEVIRDFYIGLRYYQNYDSKPISVDASTNDWGVATTIGYSFH